MPVADSVPEVSGPGISNVPAMPQGVPSTNAGLRPVYTKVPVFQPWATSHVDTFSDLAQQLQSNNFSKRASPTERAERHRIEGLMQAARNSEGNIIDTQPAARAAARPAALNVTGLPLELLEIWIPLLTHGALLLIVFSTQLEDLLDKKELSLN